jgi:hypothetical protein
VAAHQAIEIATDFGDPQMATELETTKPRLVKSAPSTSFFDPAKAGSFSTSEARKLRDGQTRARKIAAASAAAEEEIRNVENEAADRITAIRNALGDFIAGLED